MCRERLQIDNRVDLRPVGNGQPKSRRHVEHFRLTSAGQRIVATARDANGNTSEFSASDVVTAALLASELAENEPRPAALDAVALTFLLWEPIAAWESAGLDATGVAVLQSLSLEIAELPGRYLGWAAPQRIVLDSDAAGWGWSLADGSEILRLESQMDLLTVVMHGMGHVLGLADLGDADSLMADVLLPGIRRLPTVTDVDRVLARGEWGEPSSPRS